LDFLYLFIRRYRPQDRRLVSDAVGALLVVIGIALMVGSKGEQNNATTICLGLFSALALALIDIYYALRNVISKIYLGDAAVELIFVFLWIGFLCFGNSTNPSR
jgi:drug/metabolite transporter (DMT)-like permease